MRPAVWVSVFGPTLEPLYIRQDDISFSKQPRGLVEDVERLLAIPNQVFAAYTTTQKSNLVAESAVAAYPNYLLPEMVSIVPADASSSHEKPASARAARSAGKLKALTNEVHRLAPAPLEPPKSRPQP